MHSWLSQAPYGGNPSKAPRAIRKLARPPLPEHLRRRRREVGIDAVARQRVVAHHLEFHPHHAAGSVALAGRRIVHRRFRAVDYITHAARDGPSPWAEMAAILRLELLWGGWCDALDWLQDCPDASAVALLGRLEEAERIVSTGRTCVRCSGGCSSGEASWPTSWSTPRPKLRCRIPVEYRKWRW